MATKREVIQKFQDPTYVPKDGEYGQWKFYQDWAGENDKMTVDKAATIVGETLSTIPKELLGGVVEASKDILSGRIGEFAASIAEGAARGATDTNVVGRKIWQFAQSFGDDEAGNFARDREIRKLVRARENAKQGNQALISAFANDGATAKAITDKVDTKVAEAGSYFADPAFAVPIPGAGMISKGASKMGGKMLGAAGKLARVPEGIAKGVENTIAKGVSRIAPDIAPETALRGVRTAEGLALGGGALVNPTALMLRSGAAGADQVGQLLQGAGRAADLGPSRIGAFERIAKDTEVSDIARQAAQFISDKGGDTAARVAGAGLQGAAVGSVIGGGLGAITDGAEGAVAGFASGGLLGSAGGVTGLGLEHLTGIADKRATANDIQNYAARLPEDKKALFNKMSFDAKGDIALAQDILGDKISFQFVNAKEFGQRFSSGASAAHTLAADGSGVSTIFIKDSPNVGRADVLHEIGHAVYAQTPDIKTSVLSVIQNLYSPEEIRAIETEYVTKLKSADTARRGTPLTQEEKASLIAELKSEKGEDYFINEIFSETFADTAFDSTLNRVRKGKSNSILRSKLLESKAYALEKIGIPLNPDGSVDKKNLIFDIKKSPRFQKLIADYTKQLNRFRADHNKNSDPSSTKGVPRLTDDELKTSPGIDWVYDETNGRFESTTAYLIPGPGGIEDKRGGKIVRKSLKQVRKEDRARAEEVKFVVDTQEPRSADDKRLGRRKQVSGKEIITGTELPPAIYQVSSFNDNQKDHMSMVESALNPDSDSYGQVFHVHYQPAGTGKSGQYVIKNKGAVQLREFEILPFEFKVDKQGNLHYQALDFTELKERIKIWAKNGALDQVWNGDVRQFSKDVATYLANHSKKLPGETGIGEAKRNYIQAFLGGRNGTNAVRDSFPAKLRGNLVKSFRADRTNTMKPAYGRDLVSGEFGPLKYGFDYYRMRDNLTPDRSANFSPERVDSDFIKAYESGDAETAQRLVDEKAGLLGATKAYHGSKRIDRVGNRFDPDRATSGPMAFFSDSLWIAESYSRNKKDTSLEIPDSYLKWFNYNGTDIGNLYKNLTPAQKKKLHDTLPHVVEDEDGNFSLDKSKYGMTGKQHWDNTIKENNNDVVKAAVDIWLDSGTLFNREKDFVEVLKLAGINGVEFNTPWMDVPGVVDAYLLIDNPLDTSAIPADIVRKLKRNAKNKTPIYEYGVDSWDKKAISGKDWINRLEYDLKEGTTHAWTSIPDWVTKTLKRAGYDGIKDTGGKNGGNAHNVHIPFNPAQIKSAKPFTFADNGELIPISKRFDKSSEDIRFSPERLDAEYLKAVEDGDNSKAADMVKQAAAKAGYSVGPVFHGTSDGRFLDSDPVFKSEQGRFGMGRDTGVHWFSDSQRNAQTYANKPAFDYQNAEPKILPAFIKMENPLTIDAKNKLWREAQGRGKTSDVIQQAIEGGYDGVVIKNVKDDYNNDSKTKPVNTYAVFDSYQIKSADPVTKDNDGNVIPLSKRFNPGEEDIRFTPERLPDNELPTAIGSKPLGIEYDSRPTYEAVLSTKGRKTKAGVKKPGYAEKVADFFTDKIPWFPEKHKNKGYKARLEIAIEEMKDNLLFLYNAMSDTVRERSKMWYVGANKIANMWAGKYGISPEEAAGVIAVLSPQNDWFMNVSAAERILDMFKTKQDFRFDDQMAKTADKILPTFSISKKGNRTERLDNIEKRAAIDGKTLSELTNAKEIAAWIRVFDETHNNRNYAVLSPEGNKVGMSNGVVQWKSYNSIENAVKILLNTGNKQALSDALGKEHKVRNFFNNISSPGSNKYTTIDTHAGAASYFLPLGGMHKWINDIMGGSPSNAPLGLSGMYSVFQEAHNRAAKEIGNGILPREVQSITWEGIRTIFNIKNEKKLEFALGVWKDYSKGKITKAEAFQKIIDNHDGFKATSWEQYGHDSGVHIGEGWTTYDGTLHVSQIPGNAQGSGRGSAGRGGAGRDTSFSVQRPWGEGVHPEGVFGRGAGGNAGGGGIGGRFGGVAYNSSNDQERRSTLNNLNTVQYPDGYKIFTSKKRNYRAYAPTGGLLGVYNTEEQALKRIEKARSKTR